MNSIGKIHGSSLLKLDFDRLIETRLLLTASSGAGKSFALRDIIEAAYGKKLIFILDTEGEFVTLRPTHDFVILGKDGDVPLNPRHGAIYAHKFLELGRDLIVDLSELSLSERQVFVRDFLGAMVAAARNLWRDVLVVLDEAHEYAPEKSPSVASSSVIAMAAKGRKRGFALLMATQRPAKLSKDASAECQNKLIGLQNLPDDRKRGADELGFSGKEEVLTLRDMERGEFYACGPAFFDGSDRVKGVVKVQLAEPKTRPPKRGAGKAQAPAASAKLKAELKKLAALPEAIAEEVKDLAGALEEIRILKGKLAKAPQATPAPALPRVIGPTPEQVKTIVENAVAKERKTLAGMLMEAWRDWRAFEAKLQKLEKALNPKMVVRVDQSKDKRPDLYAVHGSTPTFEFPSKPARSASLPVDPDGPKLGLCERKALTFLAELAPGEYASRARIAVSIGYAAGGGSFANAMGKLNSLNFLEKRGDQYALAPGADVSAYLTGEKFSVNAWLAKLPKAERLVLQFLVDNAPQAFTRAQLAEATGYEAGGGSFANAMGKLNTLNLTQRNPDGTVRLNPDVK